MPELADRPAPKILTADHDAAFDAAMDAAGITSGDAPGDDDKPEPALRDAPKAPKVERDDAGKFAPAKPAAKVEAPVEPVKAPEKREPDADMEKALATLRRSKSFDKLIPKMSREELLETAAVERQRHSVSDDLSRRLGQFSEPRETTQSDTESTHGREPSAEQPDADNLRSVQPLLKSLGLEGDEDAGKSLAAFGHAVAHRVASQFAPLQQEVANLRGELAAGVGERVRADLVSSGRYSFEEGSQDWIAVEAKAVELLQSPAYGGNIRLALADAVRIRHGDGQPLIEPAERARRERARSNGNPDLPTGSNREKPKTHADVVDDAISTSMAAHGL